MLSACAFSGTYPTSYGRYGWSQHVLAGAAPS
jgi:hypothetical protein